nr:argininosuccinate lyase [Nitrospirota bacterium]
MSVGKKKLAAKTGKLWAGRFTERTNKLVEAFTSSLAFDRRLFPHDIEGSLAHAKTLGKAGVLTGREVSAILRGLAAVRAELEKGRFPFAP